MKWTTKELTFGISKLPDVLDKKWLWLSEIRVPIPEQISQLNIPNLSIEIMDHIQPVREMIFRRAMKQPYPDWVLMNGN